MRRIPFSRILIVFLLFRMAAAVDIPRLPFAPKHYICCRASTPVEIDGLLVDDAWQSAAWTDSFVDIEASLRPSPGFHTRAKLLWDDTYLYIAAQLEEPHVWATLRNHDDIIYGRCSKMDLSITIFMETARSK